MTMRATIAIAASGVAVGFSALTLLSSVGGPNVSMVRCTAFERESNDLWNGGYAELVSTEAFGESKIQEWLTDAGVEFFYCEKQPCPWTGCVDGPIVVPFSCVIREAGDEPENCLRKSSNGRLVDFGEWTPFPKSEAFGDGCVPFPCVEFDIRNGGAR